jgi:hypothetical protein
LSSLCVCLSVVNIVICIRLLYIHFSLLLQITELIETKLCKNVTFKNNDAAVVRTEVRTMTGCLRVCQDNVSEWYKTDIII